MSPIIFINIDQEVQAIYEKKEPRPLAIFHFLQLHFIEFTFQNRIINFHPLATDRLINIDRSLSFKRQGRMRESEEV